MDMDFFPYTNCMLGSSTHVPEHIYWNEINIKKYVRLSSKAGRSTMHLISTLLVPSWGFLNGDISNLRSDSEDVCNSVSDSEEISNSGSLLAWMRRYVTFTTDTVFENQWTSKEYRTFTKQQGRLFYQLTSTSLYGTIPFKMKNTQYSHSSPHKNWKLCLTCSVLACLLSLWGSLIH